MKENKKSEPELGSCQNGTVPQHCLKEATIYLRRLTNIII
jgi:hypothetical protein